MFIGLICFGYFYLYRHVYLNSKHFEENNINAKIINVYNYEDKTLIYFYTERYSISQYETSEDTLFVGDSISKEANTKSFRVYRKDEKGKYQFLKQYDFK